jgi:hypothetical protein
MRKNYRFERSERDRTKQAKKEEKARRQQERASQQKSPEADQTAVPIASDDGRKAGDHS